MRQTTVYSTANKNGRHYGKMNNSFNQRHIIWRSEIICQIAWKFRQKRQIIIKLKKSKLALPITFHGWKLRSKPQFRNDFGQRLGNMWQIVRPHEHEDLRRHSRHLVDGGSIHFSHLPTAKRFPRDYHVWLYGTDGLSEFCFRSLTSRLTRINNQIHITYK
jgi:hypothetical protein